MDGQFNKLEELIYVERNLNNISTQFCGEITQQMMRHADFPGSNNGTGLFQTILRLKIRHLFHQIQQEEDDELQQEPLHQLHATKVF